MTVLAKDFLMSIVGESAEVIFATYDNNYFN
jgi:hypothetical protein